MEVVPELTERADEVLVVLGDQPGVVEGIVYESSGPGKRGAPLGSPGSAAEIFNLDMNITVRFLGENINLENSGLSSCEQSLLYKVFCCFNLPPQPGE